MASLMDRRGRLEEVARQTDLRPLALSFAEAMRDFPDDWAYPMTWGRVLYNSNRYEDAEKALRRALAIAPHRYDLRAALAMVLAFEGRGEEGVDLLTQDRKADTIQSAYLLQTAQTLEAHGENKSAARFMKAREKLSRW